MDSEEHKHHSNFHQIEADFGFLWLGKFAQAILAILPGLFFGIFTPDAFGSAAATFFICAISIGFAYLINLALGGKFTDKREATTSRYIAYFLAYLTINIANLNGISSLAANLGLTALICFHSINIKNYKLPLFALVFAYLTQLFYTVLPGSSRYISETTNFANAELMSLSALFIISTYVLFKLINANKNLLIPLDEIPPLDNEIKSGDRQLLNITITGNTLIYSIFFGCIFAGADINGWGGALLIFSIIYLAIGFLYYDRSSRHSHALSWFVLFGILSIIAVSILTRGVSTIICWEVIVIILTLLSRLPYMKKINNLSILGSQIIFGYFLISEPLGKYFDPEKTTSIWNIVLAAPLFYLISANLKRDHGRKDSPLFGTLEAILILIIAISLITSSGLISILWALIGFALILIGFPTEDHSLRFGGLAVLFIALLKILVVDAAGLSSSAFLLPIVIISPILIAVGTIYQKLRDTSFRPNVVVERQHVLGAELAQERVELLTDNLKDKYSNLFHDPTKSWNDEHTILTFSIVTFGFHVAGQIAVTDRTATLKVQLPMLAMAFKSQIVNSVDDEVGHLLEP